MYDLKSPKNHSVPIFGTSSVKESNFLKTLALSMSFEEFEPIMK